MTDMHILHRVQLLLQEDNSADLNHRVQALILNADKSCMIGNLIKQSGVQITPEGKVAR